MRPYWLDSNVLLWWLIDDERLKKHDVRERLRYARRVMVSVVSPWELWIKQATGKLTRPFDFDEQVALGLGLELVSPTLADASLATGLPLLHRDPFDRMIVAQAINRQATLITSDEQLIQYGGEVVLL
ncbi:MAG: type II toxin-antitoxin system VapC family toxin [Brevundimonas sp.]|uniref:type II toxin-antitoxin system VapC family toxin n=1 Tax=Brevundimonas sp. TaxID=1871086 RepID=UPI0039196998